MASGRNRHLAGSPAAGGGGSGKGGGAASRQGSTPTAHFVFHLLAFLVFLFAACWHLKASVRHTVAEGVGFHSKYFSFWVFSEQLLALLLALLTHLFPECAALEELADDFASAAFAQANVVLVAALLMRLARAPLKAPHTLVTPTWLAATEQGLGAAVSWADLFVAHRHFRRRAFQLCMFVFVAYVAWLQSRLAGRGSYPYQFLNSLPQPEGFMCVALSILGALNGFFLLGNRISGNPPDSPTSSKHLVSRRNRHRILML